MITALCLAGYLLVAGFAFGFLGRVIGGKGESVWNTPFPLLGGMLWPITVVLIMMWVPGKLGSATFDWMEGRAKKKLAAKERKRVEIEACENEVRKYDAIHQ